MNITAAFPSPLQCLALVKEKFPDGGNYQVARVWIKPRVAWDGDGRSLAWYTDVVLRDQSSGVVSTHAGTIHSSSRPWPGGFTLDLGSGDYGFRSVETAEEKFPHPRSEGWLILDCDVWGRGVK